MSIVDRFGSDFQRDYAQKISEFRNMPEQVFVSLDAGEVLGWMHFFATAINALIDYEGAVRAAHSLIQKTFEDNVHWISAELELKPSLDKATKTAMVIQEIPELVVLNDYYTSITTVMKQLGTSERNSKSQGLVEILNVLKRRYDSLDHNYYQSQDQAHGNSGWQQQNQDGGGFRY